LQGQFAESFTFRCHPALELGCRNLEALEKFASVECDGLLQSISGPANLTVTATPLPAALPLFGSALSLFGFVGWWRKRRAEAVA
jgi:hypothetical protein